MAAQPNTTSPLRADNVVPFPASRTRAAEPFEPNQLRYGADDRAWLSRGLMWTRLAASVINMKGRDFSTSLANLSEGEGGLQGLIENLDRTAGHFAAAAELMAAARARVAHAMGGAA